MRLDLGTADILWCVENKSAFLLPCGGTDFSGFCSVPVFVPRMVVCAPGAPVNARVYVTTRSFLSLL